MITITINELGLTFPMCDEECKVGLGKLNPEVLIQRDASFVGAVSDISKINRSATELIMRFIIDDEEWFMNIRKADVFFPMSSLAFAGNDIDIIKISNSDNTAVYSLTTKGRAVVIDNKNDCMYAPRHLSKNAFINKIIRSGKLFTMLKDEKDEFSTELRFEVESSNYFIIREVSYNEIEKNGDRVLEPSNVVERTVDLSTVTTLKELIRFMYKSCLFDGTDEEFEILTFEEEVEKKSKKDDLPEIDEDINLEDEAAATL